VRVGGDDGELRPWNYIYVYSIESRLIINPKRRFFTALDPQLSTEEVLPSFVIAAVSDRYLFKVGPKSETRNPNTKTRKRESETPNPKSKTKNPKLENPKPKTQDQKKTKQKTTQNTKHKTKITKPKPQHPTKSKT
jgi:hypothetical protein